MKHRRTMIALSCLTGCLVALSASALTATQQASRANDADLVRSFKPLFAMMGPASAIKDSRLVRITDKASWEKLWKAHRGEAVDRSFDGGWEICPEIDWETCFVIARFRGESWNCYGEKVEVIDEYGDAVKLFFDSATYQTSGEDGGGVRVTPYGIWVLPRVAGKTWIVEENVQGLIGQPAIWKEQARFESLEGEQRSEPAR